MAVFVGWARLALLGLLVIAFRAGVVAQTTARIRPPLIIPSMSGSDLFRFYCASCHGSDGRGHGPVAVSLRMPPPDLTALSRRHGGSFPRPDVELYLTGDEPRPAAAHGSKEMPVWGPIFRALDPDDRTRTVRIANLLDHMESLQAK